MLTASVKKPEATHAYSLEEAEAISNALIDDPPEQLVFCLAAFMGLRPGEISALKWEDHDFLEFPLNSFTNGRHMDLVSGQPEGQFCYRSWREHVGEISALSFQFLHLWVNHIFLR